MSGLHKSYTEAVCAMKYKTINQDNSILMFDSYLANFEENDNLNGISQTVNSIVKEFKDFDDSELKEQIDTLKSQMISEKVSGILNRVNELQEPGNVKEQAVLELLMGTSEIVVGSLENILQVCEMYEKSKYVVRRIKH